MKKTFSLIVLLMAGAILLVACSDDKNEENNASEKEPQPSEERTETETDPVEEENEEEETEDQVNLTMGDSGVFDTTLGTYEITLDAAELKGKEFEGVKSTRDDIILFDITIKNTSDEPLDAEELIESMEVADDLDGAGSGDNAIGFDTVDAFEGEIEPGEEMTGHFLTTVNQADTYYFRKNPGNVAAGTSNQVIWTIEEADVE